MMLKIHFISTFLVIGIFMLTKRTCVEAGPGGVEDIEWAWLKK